MNVLRLPKKIVDAVYGLFFRCHTYVYFCGNS